MKHRSLIGLALGIALFIFVLATHDISAVAEVLIGAGWGLAWVLMWRVLSIFASAAAWRNLFLAGQRPAFSFLVLGRWISESINHLLPALQVGGDVLRARLTFLVARRNGLTLSGMMTAGIQVVDITCAFAAQVILVSIGFFQLWHRGILPWPAVLFGIAFTMVPLTLLVAVQRHEVLLGATSILGILRLQRFLQSVEEAGDSLADRFREIYRRRRSVLTAFTWHVIAGLLRVGETWSALWVFGHEVSLADAMLVDVMTGAARSVAFFIPGAIGVQESGILLICSLVGIDPSLALALALVKRGRDLVLGLPGLAAWLMTERFLLTKAEAVVPGGSPQ